MCFLGRVEPGPVHNWFVSSEKSIQELCSFSQGSMDGPLPRPRWSSEASGKPSASGKGSEYFKSLKSWRKWGEISCSSSESMSEDKSKSILWPSADPGSGAAPMMNSSSRSSSPTKVLDEGKVKSAAAQL